MRHTIFLFILFIAFYLWCPFVFADNSIGVPILTYHNFDPSAPGSMTVSTAQFEEQLQWLKTNGYTIIPLKELVNYLQDKSSSLPAKSVVITADDGRESVYQYMLPIVREYNVPVTLFIYPSVISHASYAMSWNQLKELQKTGLFDIQGHTYWHPNFKQEEKRLSLKDYEKLVRIQLFNSKNILEKKLGTKITLLAWPYGIYNNYLEQEAAKAGYVMAFSIDARHANRFGKTMAEPRYMIVADQNIKTFAAIIDGRAQEKRH